jgi:hypothetical protein
MVALLEPISSEPVALRKQLAQVKLLEDDIAEWQPQLEELNGLGARMIEFHVDDSTTVKRQKIVDDLKVLNGNWQALVTAVQQRKQALSDALLAGEQIDQFSADFT